MAKHSPKERRISEMQSSPPTVTEAEAVPAVIGCRARRTFFAQKRGRPGGHQMGKNDIKTAD